MPRTRTRFAAYALAVDGVLGILFGVVLFVYPSAGARAVVWLIGAYAIVSRVSLVALAFRLRKLAGCYAGKLAWVDRGTRLRIS